ncbi:hypothetical protein PHLCEN_2v10892 [Hermanssonia centrifuga]|uniref:Uncharacterized protein n=1 Tax=Hermanssonia centrifuga TaxID=98765 RepID=A0A2R6NLH2_9APHY|nr:hypothetical protein PHLCEN_2v10892 [Hermanssonia centrifuga]
MKEYGDIDRCTTPLFYFGGGDGGPKINKNLSDQLQQKMTKGSGPNRPARGEVGIAGEGTMPTGAARGFAKIAKFSDFRTKFDLKMDTDASTVPKPANSAVEVLQLVGPRREELL